MHDQYTLGVRCSRSTIDGGSCSFFVCALSTLAKSSWKWIQLQQEHTNSKSWWQRPPMLAAKSPASCAVAKTIHRSVRLLGDAHALPIDDRRRTPSVLALTTLSNNDWHYKQVQYEHANTNLKAKATYVHSKPWCCVPFAGKVPSSLQIRDLERTSHTQNAVCWFLFGSYVPTASTLEEKLLTQNPSTR